MNCYLVTFGFTANGDILFEDTVYADDLWSAQEAAENLAESEDCDVLDIAEAE